MRTVRLGRQGSAGVPGGREASLAGNGSRRIPLGRGGEKRFCDGGRVDRSHSQRGLAEGFQVVALRAPHPSGFHHAGFSGPPRRGGAPRLAAASIGRRARQDGADSTCQARRPCRVHRLASRPLRRSRIDGAGVETRIRRPVESRVHAVGHVSPSGRSRAEVARPRENVSRTRRRVQATALGSARQTVPLRLRRSGFREIDVLPLGYLAHV